ncbi:hypothetical protein BASA61_010243 [Batrachochytrium salamandrivorans]|nr:hypothetical protein BASA62_010410 [Batrachochytrium salamandrivorans]KAH6579491.1 hypothetical protein BASA61_010243 [Batrachochytrium salamandrivorans]KAH6583258.1 hypothetical protein BASA60_001530 [Batrachochytrium salamandrivorans]KAH9274404.1 hypothetical protein BASA83_003034 [Batrachochytrium salamandrivorans]
MPIMFGPWPIRPTEVFFTSKLSMGLVNLKPLVTVVPRFIDLTPDEASDLFKSAHQIAKIIEKEHNAESLSIAMQDGTAAGQSVAHVHIHIIPRYRGDWMNNDDIYPEIQRKECELALETARRAGDTATVSAMERKTKSFSGPDAEDRPPRSLEEMAAESASLRPFFEQHDDIWSTSSA